MNTVILRVTKKQSSHKPPIHDDNKYELIKLCYQSFLNTANVDYELIVVVDDVPESWLDIFNNAQFEYAHENEGTFHKQLEIARNKEKVLLLEDDYLWRPNTLQSLFKAVETLSFVSPYDHPGHYLEERFDKHYETTLIDNAVYRRAPSNTLTFASTGEKIRKHFSTFMSYGIRDHEMWQDIGDIWNPTHSFATHMVEGLLAPNVDWYDIMNS